jgi:hypothetical protein
MRVQASLQFSCATTGHNLETQLSTETSNLIIFRQGNAPTRCAFCGGEHYWRLIEYHRPVRNHKPRPPRASTPIENYLGMGLDNSEIACAGDGGGNPRQQ